MDPGYIWVTPGLFERALVLSALPVFLVAMAVVRGLARLGINELRGFMFTTPILILAWFYTVGWLLDRWRYRRSIASSIGQSVVGVNIASPRSDPRPVLPQQFMSFQMLVDEISLRAPTV